MELSSENYQLKWHSFGSYLHSCVAASMHGESFADVSLLTMDGRQIHAHRFILSACSQYLHQVLRLQTKSNHFTPLSIILPPEINYRTLKVLIQYMYSGEATVSQDILESVLRGGDLLKVKGLWRPKEDEPQRNEHTDRNERQERRTTPKTHHNLNSSKHASRSNVSTPANSTYSASCSPPHVNNSVIKESRLIQDPVDKVIPMSTKRQKCDESVIKTTLNTPPPLAPIQTRQKFHEKAQEDRNKMEKLAKNGENDNDKMVDGGTTPKDLMQILVIKEEPIEWSEVNQDEIELVEREEIFESELIIKPEIQMDDHDDHPEELYTPLTCELCSETFTIPADWVKHVRTHTDMMPAKRQKRGRPSNDEDGSNFPPLQCDMCQEYFTTPAKWVQHIQNAHTELEMQMHNLARHGGVATPVRQSQRSSSSQYSTQTKLTSQHKVCAVCNKKFPSHASMIIHRRTHTGEKPYMCDYCCKGFNVKSNLLRHLRTLHDKYVNPTDVESKEGEESDV